MTSWQDVLIGGSDQLDPSIISPTMDAAIVDAARRQLLDPAIGRPGMHAYVAEMTTQFLQEQVATYGTRLHRTQAQIEAAEVADAVRGIGPRYEREEVAS